MTKVTIISGFLGAGKTTFIKKLIEEIYKGQKVVLIENEFGEIGIDGGFLKDAGVQINEMNSGCICCSLVGDFGKALKQVSHDYAPDMIIIEPSGVGKLSDVIAAVENVKEEADLELENFITVADATKCKLYMKNFGEFYNNQLESATTVVLSRTQNVDEAKLETAVNLIKEHNDKASIITTPWDELTGEQIMSALKHTSLVDDMLKDMDICPECGHHHEHNEECCTMTMTNMNTIITTMMKSAAIMTMNIIITTMMENADAIMSMDIIMQMTYLTAGERRPLISMTEKRLKLFLNVLLRQKNSVLF